MNSCIRLLFVLAVTTTFPTFPAFAQDAPPAASPQKNRDQATALKEFDTDFKAVKKWMQGEIEKGPMNRIRSFRLMLEMAPKFKAVRTDGLPADLTTAWQEVLKGMDTATALFKGVPADEEEIQKWIDKNTEQEKSFLKDLRDDVKKASAASQAAGVELEKAAAKYGLTISLDPDQKPVAPPETKPAPPDEDKPNPNATPAGEPRNQATALKELETDFKSFQKWADKSFKDAPKNSTARLRVILEAAAKFNAIRKDALPPDLADACRDLTLNMNLMPGFLDYVAADDKAIEKWLEEKTAANEHFAGELRDNLKIASRAIDEAAKRVSVVGAKYDLNLDFGLDTKDPKKPAPAK